MCRKEEGLSVKAKSGRMSVLAERKLRVEKREAKGMAGLCCCQGVPAPLGPEVPWEPQPEDDG